MINDVAFDAVSVDVVIFRVFGDFNNNCTVEPRSALLDQLVKLEHHFFVFSLFCSVRRDVFCCASYAPGGLSPVGSVHAFLQNLFFYATTNNDEFRRHMLVETLLIPRLVLPYLDRCVLHAMILNNR